MKTPKEYTDFLKKSIITENMLDSALWSVNKRAKNWRDNKRVAHGYYRMQNYNNALDKEEEMYSRKEKLLSLLKPVCIHKEFAGFKKTRVYDYEKNYKNQFLTHAIHEEIVWVNSYLDYDTYAEVSFFDYVDTSQPEYRYYLFYETENHSYHTPISKDEIELYQNKYNIKVVEIDQINTNGNDIADLISVQFVDKLIALIDTGNYTFINNFVSNSASNENEKIEHSINNFSIDMLWGEIINQVSFEKEISEYKYDLSKEERKEIEEDNKLFLQSQQKKKKKKKKCKGYKCHKKLKIVPTDELINSLKKYDILNYNILKEEMKKYFPEEIKDFVENNKKIKKKNEYSKKYFSDMLAHNT